MNTDFKISGLLNVLGYNTSVAYCQLQVASFPGLPTVQQKNPPFCILQVIKNWMVGRSSNEAKLQVC